jgi:citrate lyase beta subunit
MGMAGKWVGHPAQLFAVLLAFDAMADADDLERAAQQVAGYTAAVQDEARGATIIEGLMADRATDRHARARLRRAVAMGHFDPRRALDLGIIEPQELANAQAAWRR